MSAVAVQMPAQNSRTRVSIASDEADRIAVRREQRHQPGGGDARKQQPQAARQP